MCLFPLPPLTCNISAFKFVVEPTVSHAHIWVLLTPAADYYNHYTLVKILCHSCTIILRSFLSLIM